MRNLETYTTPSTSAMTVGNRKIQIPAANCSDFAASTAKVLSGLQEMGIRTKATDLPKLLPSDPYEPALHIMATVRAYFQGASAAHNFAVSP